MRGVARIRYRDGGVMLPAQSPYERELLLATLCHCLQRSGSAQLELDGRRWALSCRAQLDPPPCAVCRRTTRVYGIADARVDGPVCAACLAVLLRVAPPANGAALDAADQPLRRAAASGAPIPSAIPAPAARKGAAPWLRSI